MADFERMPVEYANAVVRFPQGIYKREKELYISKVKGALYVKSKKQFSRFMNGAKRSRDEQTRQFYDACCNHSVVVPYSDCCFEVTQEIADVLDDENQNEIVVFNDSSGLILGTKAFFDSKLNK